MGGLAVSGVFGGPGAGNVGFNIGDRLPMNNWTSLY
jgi:hypothetical protein